LSAAVKVSVAVANKTARTTRLKGIMNDNFFIFSGTASSFKSNDPSF